MKNLLLVDFGHLSSRMVHTAIHLSKPSKKDGKYVTADFQSMLFHMVLNSLRFSMKRFKSDEVVIFLDGFGSWRKDVYPEYKGNRDKSESDINWETLYVVLNELTDTMKEAFPFKVIGLDKTEADDGIAVIAKEYSPIYNVTILSEDKDFFQLLKHRGVKQYRPIKKDFVSMTPEEAEDYAILHRCLGDAVDNIPNIKSRTAFSPTFISYLKENEIYTTSVPEFLKLSISEKLMSDFTVFKKITAGKKKGQMSDIKDIYKTVPFGEKGALKFVQDLEVNLSENVMYRKNYDLNYILTSFDAIPDYIYNPVVKDFKEQTIQFNAKKINDFLLKYSLGELFANASDFYISGAEVETSLADFF